LIKEVDVPRVRENVRTAWVEDPNFVGIRPTLKPRLEAGLAAFEPAQRELIRVLEASDADPKQLMELSAKAQNAGVAFWNVATGELDALLQMQVESLREERNRALALSILSLAGAAFLAFFLLRSITQPLLLVVRELSPESVAMRVSAERLSLRRLRDALSEDESVQLSAELNQHSMTIRRAVIELVAQISGGAGDLASRVEGARWSTPPK
jgi:methyl-accepting chemotaxis protein